MLSLGGKGKPLFLSTLTFVQALPDGDGDLPYLV